MVGYNELRDWMKRRKWGSIVREWFEFIERRHV